MPRDDLEDEVDEEAVMGIDDSEPFDNSERPGREMLVKSMEEFVEGVLEAGGKLIKEGEEMDLNATHDYVLLSFEKNSDNKRVIMIPMGYIPEVKKHKSDSMIKYMGQVIRA